MGGFEAASLAEKAKGGEIFGHLNSLTWGVFIAAPSTEASEWVSVWMLHAELQCMGGVTNI